ncbi:lysophospholipase L1-like esterase [Pseudonocardia sediminis]|uniref:Lysophospholipase L1-like esterase n=1 Tax=Pseudonocardia sediminis TaxID=1397368 RepID=A0A4Q7UV05_PSEST|nr:SGNH/GDSL hydrolase family protein [Pseudonocardia sediminis]RZT83869.1 lysophospholipase L1-like esterase [Pseudonocardia sediminis]
MGDRGTDGFEYSNLTGRPPGRIISAAGRVFRGIRKVQAQVEPYAHEWEQHNRAALARSGPLWVALGDSMAQGIGASVPWRGWVGQLALEIPQYRLVNLSLSGGRVVDVLRTQLPALEALPAPPDLVTCLIGSNDLMNPKHRANAASGMAEMLERLPVGTVVGNQPGTFDAALEINALIDDAVARRGLVLADLRDPRTRHWRGKLSPDRFHPNDRGYAGIAAVFSEALARR